MAIDIPISLDAYLYGIVNKSLTYLFKVFLTLGNLFTHTTCLYKWLCGDSPARKVSHPLKLNGTSVLMGRRRIAEALNHDALMWLKTKLRRGKSLVEYK